MDYHRALIGLLLLTAWVYAPLRSAPFVYEDAGYVDTPVRWTLPGRGLSVASVHLTGQSAGAAHLVNIGLHLVNGALVYTLGLALTAPLIALGAAGLFLLHPLNSEAVSYIGARADLLVTLWALLACGLIVRWTERGGWYRLTGAALAMLAAGLSKEIGLIVVPLLVLTVGLWRRERPATHLLLTGLLCSAGVAVAATWWQLSWWLGVTPGAGGSSWPWPAFALRQAAQLGRLLLLLVWPVGFSIDHDALAPGGFARAVAVVGLTGLLALCALTWRKAPMAAWASGWLLIAVAPRFLFATNEWISEYQLYPAMGGLSLGLASLALKGSNEYAHV